MTLTVRLKQHTPIIHFQHDQKGATLRASELKPKLDRYIRKKYYGDDKDVKLKYQLCIKFLTDGKTNKINNDSMYFGNLKQPKHRKKMEVYGSELELKINTYFNKTLADQIKEMLPVCLALENFGTRNNKGNGCFFLKDSKLDDFEKIVSKYSPSILYYWDCNSADAFFAIKTVYALLKSGINLTSNPVLSNNDYESLKKDYHKDFDALNHANLIKEINQHAHYEVLLNLTRKKRVVLSPSTLKFLDPKRSHTYYKSLLFKYFKDQGITWDKKAVKTTFLPAAPSDNWHTDEYRFVRGLLGVSDVQSWYTHSKTLSIRSSEFERVPSPLVFKVFDKGNNKRRIYLFARDSYKHLKGKSFDFTMSGCKGSLTLSIPDTFDINNYLKYAVGQINNLSIYNDKRMITIGLVKRVDTILTKIKDSQIRKLS